MTDAETSVVAAVIARASAEELDELRLKLLQERTTELVREELRRLLWVENKAHLERVDYCWKHNVPDEVMESIRTEVRAAQREARMKARGG